MKKLAVLLLSALVLLTAAPSRGANVPYFPYDTIDNYYKTQPEQPTVTPPPVPQPLEPVVKPAARPEQPAEITAPPEFLFPAKLGFGVAVGVPYDLAYVSGKYYYWKGGEWYRSSTYRGPWIAMGISQLPPELRKQTLSRIRQLRNSEFSSYWKDREKYQGKRFRPGEEVKEPAEGRK
jgi:hypothetical protein